MPCPQKRRCLLKLLALSAAAAAAGPWLAGWPIWVAPLIFLPAHLALLWAQLSARSTWLGPVVTRFRPAEGRREIWLTIDDGPDPAETPAVLEVLDRHGAKATFFTIGEKVAQNPELVREIRRRGHQVANHSATHPQSWFWTLSRARVARELDAGAAALRAALGPDDLPPPIFRSPVGMKPPALHPLLAERGWKLVAWSARGRDGAARPDLAAALDRLTRGVRPGAILVLHEGRGHAPALLETLLPRLHEAGLACAVPTFDSLDDGSEPAGRR